MVAFNVTLEGEQFPEGNEATASLIHGMYVCLSDLDTVIPYKDDTYIMWRFIEPYGMTVFNERQMEQFIKEIDRLLLIAKPNHKVDLDHIKQLALRCKSQHHLYLKFYGD